MANAQRNRDVSRPLAHSWKWQYNEYFAYHRAGWDGFRGFRDRSAKWNTVWRGYPTYNLAPNPATMPTKPANWEDIYKQQTSSIGPYAPRSEARRYNLPDDQEVLSGTGRPPNSMRGQRQRVENLQQRSIISFGIPITIKKVLGMGGGGLVMLCTSTSPAQGGPREFCLKADLSDGEFGLDFL